MRRFTTTALTVLALLFVAGMAYAAQSGYNKDLKNVGITPASDIHVLISGSLTINQHYDGYSVRHFGSFSYGPNGGNTELGWWGLSEPSGNNLVDPNEIVHVGWWTSTEHNILDMWWTDGSGNRIPGSAVYNVKTHWTYESSSAPGTGLPVVFRYKVTAPGTAATSVDFAEVVPDAGKRVSSVTWTNSFAPQVGGVQTVTIDSVMYAIVTTQVPLDQLNKENTTLAVAFKPLPGGTSFTVAPGATTGLDIPVPAPGLPPWGGWLLGALLLALGSWLLLSARRRGLSEA